MLCCFIRSVVLLLFSHFPSLFELLVNASLGFVCILQSAEETSAALIKLSLQYACAWAIEIKVEFVLGYQLTPVYGAASSASQHVCS